MELVVVKLLDKLKSKEAMVGVIGLGSVGLPMAVEIASAGFAVTGFDLDAAKIQSINRGVSPITHVPSDVVGALVAKGMLQATSDSGRLEGMDVALICVPTSINSDSTPDISAILAVQEVIAQYLHSQMLVILQSTSPIGTTREHLLRALESCGMQVGEDFYLSFSPERIDPGNKRYNIRNTPKLVGGVTAACTEVSLAFFQHFVDSMVPVSTPDVAEMAKLVENAFRFVNISFVNEMAMLCDRLDMNVWEVMQAAASKPFGFMPHFPSPGVGGDCIPVVPLFLEATAREHGMTTGSVEFAVRVNDEMPGLVIKKVSEGLRAFNTPLAEAHICVLGVTYKPDVADIRESAALKVLAGLVQAKANVTYHDPLIGSLIVDGLPYESQPLTKEYLRSQDCVVVLTGHSTVDYDSVILNARLVFDTRSGLQPPSSPNVVNIWRPGAAVSMESLT